MLGGKAVMEAAAIVELIQSFGPGMGVGGLGLWFGFKKDAQCTALMERIITIAEGQTASNAQVSSSLDAIRAAIKLGTGS